MIRFLGSCHSCRKPLCLLLAHAGHAVQKACILQAALAQIGHQRTSSSAPHQLWFLPALLEERPGLVGVIVCAGSPGVY